VEQYKDIISLVLKHVPGEFREDAEQAGYVGLLNGLRHVDKAENTRGYLYRCVSNAVIKEIASLQRPFALNSDVFCKLLKYRKLKRFGLERKAKFNAMSMEQLERIMSSEQRGLLDG